MKDGGVFSHFSRCVEFTFFTPFSRPRGLFFFSRFFTLNFFVHPAVFVFFVFFRAFRVLRETFIVVCHERRESTLVHEFHKTGELMATSGPNMTENRHCEDNADVPTKVSVRPTPPTAVRENFTAAMSFTWLFPRVAGSFQN